MSWKVDMTRHELIEVIDAMLPCALLFMDQQARERPDLVPPGYRLIPAHNDTLWRVLGDGARRRLRLVKPVNATATGPAEGGASPRPGAGTSSPEATTQEVTDAG